MIWLYSLGSVVVVSLVSLIGIITFRWKEEQIKPFLLMLVSFSAGALMGDAFIHLIPEAAKSGDISTFASIAILSGIMTFFILEKFVQWHHCHIPHTHVHAKPFATMNVLGDGLHNFIDGMVIAGSYMISIPVGFATTIAVVLHEIPQEISDFGVLIHAGLTRWRALFLNFISALTAILGTLLVLILGAKSTTFLEFLIPFTAGGFIYIAGVDLIPELQKETNPLGSLVQLISLLAGIGFMLALLLLEK